MEAGREKWVCVSSSQEVVAVATVYPADLLLSLFPREERPTKILKELLPKLI